MLATVDADKEIVGNQKCVQGTRKPPHAVAKQYFPTKLKMAYFINS